MEQPFTPTFINLEYIFNKVLVFLTNFFNGAVSDTTLSVARTILSIFAILLITLIVYCLVRLHELREERKKILTNGISLSKDALPVNSKWQTVQTYMVSPNPADWKLAILEADLILDEMIEKMRYPGVNLGDRMKAIEKSDFTSLNEAWEAHKVRNRIAHEGADFSISRTEARRVLGLYETVFREFDYI